MKLDQLREDRSDTIIAWCKQHWKIDTSKRWKQDGNHLWWPRTNGKEIHVEVKRDVVDLYVTNPDGRKIDNFELDSTTPFKIGRCENVNLLCENGWHELNQLPAVSNEVIWFDSEALTSFKGISRIIKQVNEITLGDRLPESLTGMLELASLNFVLPEVRGDFYPLGGVLAKTPIAAAAALINTHLKKYGPQQKILELRKQLIEAGLEMHL